jgi:TRAP-type C4-dicarboxylate transport system substrate-binding protein
MKEVDTLAGLNGLKIRTFASPLQIKPMEKLGATPVPLALTEVVPQLQSGGLDGMLVGMPILTPSNITTSASTSSICASRRSSQ